MSLAYFIMIISISILILTRMRMLHCSSGFSLGKRKPGMVKMIILVMTRMISISISMTTRMRIFVF